MSLKGKTIGLLSNSKLNADVLLRETAAIFQTEHQCNVTDIRFKRNASVRGDRALGAQVATARPGHYGLDVTPGARRERLSLRARRVATTTTPS